MSRHRGITRIEIVLVLISVAVLLMVIWPNQLQTSGRSTYARVRGELRTIQVGLSAYFIDHGEYPRNTWGDPPYNDRYAGIRGTDERTFGNLGPWITTPVAYLTRFDIRDPFMVGRSERADGLIYTYGSLKTLTYISKEFDAYPGANLKLIEERFGEYFLLSYGPDKSGGGAGELFFIEYDPTNGVESFGNIIAGQKPKIPSKN